MNINEIAELAGVSRATVSRYLNDGYVSEEKRAAIRKVIEETGYRPSQQARNLRSKVTKLVGVIIPDIESGSVSQMVSGISEVLSVKGYQLLLADTRNNTRAELKYLRIFEKNQVDGIIFMGTMLSREHLYLMEEVEVPIVVTAQEIRQYSCVFQDDYHAAYDAAKMLTKKGRHIAYIGEPAKTKRQEKHERADFWMQWQMPASGWTDPVCMKRNCACRAVTRKLQKYGKHIRKWTLCSVQRTALPSEH